MNVKAKIKQLTMGHEPHCAHGSIVACYCDVLMLCFWHLQVFVEFDTDGDGKLSPHELSSLITLIPQLQQYEQGLILAVAAQFGDLDGDGCLSLQELLGVTEAFNKHQLVMLQKQRMQQQRCL